MTNSHSLFSDVKFSVKSILQACITLLAFLVKLPVSDAGESVVLNLTTSFEGFRFTHVVLLIGLIILYSITEKSFAKEGRAPKNVIIPAVLFSLFIVFGKSFAIDNSWYSVFSFRNGQFLKAVLIFAGYYLLFKRLIHCLFLFLDRKAKEGACEVKALRSCRVLSWYLQALNAHPFRTAFLTLAIAYIPYFIVSYPAKFMGDTPIQISQAFPELRETMSYLTPDHMLSPDVFLNQHHPVIHTLLIHACIRFGDLVFRSFNVGIFIYMLIQAISFMAVISYAIHVFQTRKAISPIFAVFFIIYAIVHPLIHSYMGVVTKDIIYTVFVMLVVLNSWRLLSGEYTHRIIAGLLLSCIGMVLFRNDARYVLIGFFVMVAVLSKQMRKQALLMLGAVFAFSFLVFNVLFPALKITPGSTREMLSVPFQQTARYIRDHGDDVTGEEENIIDSVLDYNKLSEKYNPNHAGAVKNTFKEGSTRKELLAYFKTWFKMGLRHPGTYIQATMSNYYEYFYPEEVRFNTLSYEWSQYCMDDTNERIAPFNKRFSHPEKLNRLRGILDRIQSGIKNVPGFSMLMSPAIYVWSVILMLFYAIRRRNRNALSLMVLPVAMVLICLLGPCNGSYGRYIYPIVVCVPMLFVCLFSLVKEKPEQETVKGNSN